MPSKTYYFDFVEVHLYVRIIAIGFVVNGINNVNTTTIERRFNLPSSQVGLISSAYDISAGILVIPITYFGNFGHQPRILAGGAASLAIGSFIMSIPHFASGVYETGTSVAADCLAPGMSKKYNVWQHYKRSLLHDRICSDV